MQELARWLEHMANPRPRTSHVSSLAAWALEALGTLGAVGALSSIRNVFLKSQTDCLRYSLSSMYEKYRVIPINKKMPMPVVEDLHMLVREVQGRRTDLAAALATVAEQDLCRQLLRGISEMAEDVQEGHSWC